MCPYRETARFLSREVEQCRIVSLDLRRRTITYAGETRVVAPVLWDVLHAALRHEKNPVRAGKQARTARAWRGLVARANDLLFEIGASLLIQHDRHGNVWLRYGHIRGVQNCSAKSQKRAVLGTEKCNITADCIFPP